MDKRIPEKELFLPAIYVIYRNKEKVNTTKIIEVLSGLFQPTGKDGELLQGRSDTKFSQKVRNLMGSHYTTNGMSSHTNKDTDGYFTLTEQGVKAVEDNEEFLCHLFDNSEWYEAAIDLAGKLHYAHSQHRELYVLDENNIVSEGKAGTKTTKVIRSCVMQQFNTIL